MTTYRWHPHSAKHRYAFAAVCAVLVPLVWLTTRSEPAWWPRGLASLFGLLAGLSLIEQETRIDPDARAIVREGRLFGRYRVWLRHHPLSEFASVVVSRTSANDGDTLFVGLRRHHGRHLWVRYFSAVQGQPCREAEQVARQLAAVTGLELIESET